MSNLRNSNVIAVLVSDIHLSSKKPPCRTDDPSWFDIMRNYLQQLNDAAIKYDAPIICAGDIFDKWNSTPELINFALRYMPVVYAVPGQHDLPNHNSNEVHRSAYGTLVEAGTVHPLPPGKPILISEDLTVVGFPWEVPITPVERNDTSIHLAVIHAYCWAKGKSYPGAKGNQKVGAYKKQLASYDAAVFGDNHKGFLGKAGDCNVLNNGGFIRRKSDEVDYQPCIGLLYDDGSITRLPLDTSIDVFEVSEKASDTEEFDISSFVTELESLAEGGVNFVEAVERYLNDNKEQVAETTRTLITQLLKQ